MIMRHDHRAGEVDGPPQRSFGLGFVAPRLSNDAIVEMQAGIERVLRDGGGAGPRRLLQPAGIGERADRADLRR